MTEVIYTRGAMASGKTTYALNWVKLAPNRVRVNRDDIRFQLYGVYWGEPIDENVVSTIEEAMITAALKAGNDVIVDATHLAAKNAHRIIKIGHKAGAHVHNADFPVSLDLAITRDKFRKAAGHRAVGEDVIRKTFERFHINPTTGKLPSAVKVNWHGPTVFKPYTETPGVPNAILVDIDGTLAHMTGRSPYDPTRYHEDIIDEVIRDIVDGWLVHQSFKSDFGAPYRSTVIVMSGRDEKYRIETSDWLAKNGVTHDLLFMRPEGDTRNDAIVKNELFEKYVAGFFNVDFVLDDRDRVVEMWRAKGLKVLQVAEGAF